jgi:hypothetical protein
MVVVRLERSSRRNEAGVGVNPTTYSLRFRIRATGEVRERAFDSMLARTIFVITIEDEGLGTALQEWTS